MFLFFLRLRGLASFMTPDLRRKMMPGGGGGGATTTEWGEEFKMRNLEVESGIRSLTKMLNVDISDAKEEQNVVDANKK